MELTNSKRVLRSSSYVMIEQTTEEQAENDVRSGRALEKLNFIRQVRIKPEDVERIKALTLQNLDAVENTRVEESFARLSRIVGTLGCCSLRS